MGIPFTMTMGFLLTVTMGKLFTMTLGIQLTISMPEPDALRHSIRSSGNQSYFMRIPAPTERQSSPGQSSA